MKRVMLLRHALPDRETHSGQDKDRPLQPAGVAQAQRLGDIMRERKLLPDYIACSSALRTRQTLDHLNLKNIKTEFFDSLYLPKRQTIEEHIQFELPDQADTVLIIIHFPGVQDYTYEYANHIHHFPEGSLAIFEQDTNDWQDFKKPELRDFISGLGF